MRASSIVSLVLCGSVFAAPALAADGGGPSAAVPVPYDEPSAPAADQVEPLTTPRAPAPLQLSPPAAPATQATQVTQVTQVTDDETPRRTRAVPLVLDAPQVERSAFDPDPSEPGRIIGESIVAFFTADLGLAVGVVAGGLPILAVPLLTGSVVCAIGSGSDSFDGSCGAAIGGSYVGSLFAIPMGFLFAAQGSSSDDALPLAIVGVVVGMVVGSAAGAVVGWNMSREPRSHSSADVARLDAVASARALPWTEPLRARGALLAAAEPRLSVPLLALRF